MKTPRLRARWFLALAVGGALAVAACEKPRETAHEPPRQREPRPRVAFKVPGDESIPAGREGELIRRGRTIAMRTAEELPDVVASDLHCTSCHLEAGTKAGAGPWVGLASVFPEYRARAGREIVLEERIDECFERSMNSKAPGHGSETMNALVAYIEWLSRDVPRGSEVAGRGFKKLERPPNVDPDQGKISYEVRCASCHGAAGEGRRADDGSIQFPALWGDRSFNIAAGMARLDTAAAFVRHNMPLGQPDSLTATEAYDIAAYFTTQPRADFEKRSSDWPHGGKPPDARY